MQSRRLILALMLLILTAALSARAYVPMQMTVQGRLSTDKGQPLGDREVRLTFKIWTAEVGGFEQWPRVEGEELHVVITDPGGLWNVQIGGSYPISPEVFYPRGNEIDDTTRWLEVNVEGTTLPRVRILSGPFSYKVSTVEGALGGNIYGNINLHSQLKVGDEAGDAGRIKVTDGSATTMTLEGTTGDLTISGKATIGDGHTNTGAYGFVAGRWGTVTGDDGVVSGGKFGEAAGEISTVGGGNMNRALGQASVVSGGAWNTAAANATTVGGGYQNLAGAEGATVAGGDNNSARGLFSVIGGGGGQLTGDSNAVHGMNAVIGGGRRNFAEGRFSTIGGGDSNLVIDATTSGKVSDWSTIGGGRRNRVYDSLVTIGGGSDNYVRFYYGTIAGGFGNRVEDAPYAFIGGGKSNRADGNQAVIGGGIENEAIGAGSFVGGGSENSASGSWTTIGGGTKNWVSGTNSTIGGGSNNTIGSFYATIPGGEWNQVQGDAGFAAGYRAQAMHSGSVVIAANARSNSSDSARTSGSEQMVLRADGHFYLTDQAGNASIPGGDFLNTSTGAHLTTGGVWTNSSDAKKKENFRSVDRSELLSLLAELEISEWNYKAESDNVRHIGPTAQDFHALFGLGTDNVSIATTDPAGIALAAIQELNKRNAELLQLIAALTQRVEELETRR